MRKIFELQRTIMNQVMIISIFLTMFIAGCGIPVSKNLAKKFFLEKQTVYVYPVHVLAGNDCRFDSSMAKKIVDYINQKGSVHAVLVSQQPAVYNRWHHNEAKMFKNSFLAFSGFINTELKEGEYALLVQLLMNPKETYLGAVHSYIAHKNDKNAVCLNLMNSHHPFYREVNPKSREDGFKIFCKAFDQDMINFVKNN